VKAAAGAKVQGAAEKEVIHLSCQEKIDYCQGAIDEVQGLGDRMQDERSALPVAQAQTGFADSVKRLQECIETLRFQQKAIAAFQERIKWMETFEAKANDKLKSKIKEKIESLKNEKKTLDTLNCTKNDLYTLFVERYQLYRLMYERVRSEQ
jgi:DNA repair ATPase RecN